MSAPVIAVFGADGAQGGELASAILADPRRTFGARAIVQAPESSAARALVRAGAQIAVVDLDDSASVSRALQGVHGAFCVTDFFAHRLPEREIAQAATMAAAAARAGVKHVIWSTQEDTRDYVTVGRGTLPALHGQYNVPCCDGKGAANHVFFDHRVPTTLLYPSFPWDDLPRFGLLRVADERIELVLPTADCKLPGIAAEDIGRCALGIFQQGEGLVGKSIGIAGELLSGAQMAEQLGLALDATVVHRALTPAQYRALGLPGADDLGSLFQFMCEYERRVCDARSVAVARDLNPRLKTFAGWLAANKHLFARRQPVGALSPLGDSR